MIQEQEKWSINKLHEKEFIDHCKESCPFECNYVEYSTSTNQALYPTLSRLEELINVFNFNNMITNNQTASQAFAKVNIYYKGMYHTETTEVAKMQVVDLVGNLGGAFGLFLG